MTTRAVPGTIEMSSSLLLDCAWAVLESWNKQAEWLVSLLFLVMGSCGYTARHGLWLPSG